MDDRDQDLTGLFVRDLDEIPLPARGAWRRVSGRESNLMRASRTLLAAGAVVAVLAIALILGLQLRDRTETAASPSASPTPSASGATVVAPSATPAATSTPGGVIYNDDFGFVGADVGSGVSIRSESGAPRQGLSFSAQGFAVSPDGKNIAYWTVGTSSGPQQLRTFTTLGNATEQTWVTLAAGVRGGGIAWSSDGAALLYSTETGNFGISGGANSATLNVYELAADGRHGTTIDTQTNTGWLYRPIAWDRSANLAAAALTGEGASMTFYVTVRLNPDNSYTVQRVDNRSRDSGLSLGTASTDGKLVLAIDGFSGNIVWWPLADIGAKKTASGTGKTGARWQPGTHKIGFISADGGFVLFQTDDGSASTPFRGVKSGSTVRTFRADGTAVVLSFIPPGTTGLGSTDYTLTRLADGASVAFQATAGLGASVRLR